MLGGEQVGPTTAKKHKPHKAPSSGMVLGAPQGQQNMVSLRDSLGPGTSWSGCLSNSHNVQVPKRSGREGSINAGLQGASSPTAQFPGPKASGQKWRLPLPFLSASPLPSRCLQPASRSPKTQGCFWSFLLEEK